MIQRTHADRLPVFLTVLTVLACGDPATRSHGTGGGGGGGTLVVAAAGDADNLFPPLTITSQGRQVTDQVFDYLADIGPGLNTVGDGGFTPRLARSWDWAPDSLSIAFHLDPRARWHDGRAVTANDVRFTYQLVVDTALASPVASTIGNVDSVTVSDSTTTVFWFRRRTPEQFFEVAYNLAILPAHLLRDVPVRSLASSNFARHPVGTGRFRFARWDGGARIELERDPSNYRGPAKLDRIVWLISPDAQAATTRFLAGEADFIDVVRGPTVAQIERAPRLRLMSAVSLDYGYLGFNMRRPLFRDRELRRALSMAVDRSAMARNVFDTLALPGIGPLTRAQPTAYGAGAAGASAALRSADATVLPLAFDPAAAERIIARRKPIAFHLIVPTSSAIRMQYATLLQAQYQRIGVTVSVESLELNAFAQRLETGDYDAVLNAWHTDPGPAAVRQAWSGGALPPNGANFTGYSSGRFDALIDRASRTFDPDSSRATYRQAYSVINADAPAVWLYEAKSVSGVNRRVHVVGVRADRWWSDMADWTVQPR